jgi:hypothetical protein
MDHIPQLPIQGDTADFLLAIWGNGPHAICWMNPGGPFTYDIVSLPGHVLEHLHQLQGADVWVSAHPLKSRPLRGRGDRDDVAEVVALPADLDWAHPTRRTDDPLPSEAEVRDGLRRLGPDLQPSIVVHSGHGLQAYWLLAYAITDLDEAEQLIDQLDAALARVGLANGRSDLPSILRLPGTQNHKGGQPVPVTIEKLDSERRFTPPYLRKRLPQASGGSRKGGTKHRRGSVTDGQQQLTNLVVTRYGGHDIDVWRDGSVHIVRPGKPARDGSSASIIVGDRGDAILSVFSDHWDPIGRRPTDHGPAREWMLGADGELCHPSQIDKQITINVQPQPPAVIDVYQPDATSVFIDWQVFAKRDTDAHDWLVENFWPLGRAMALWAGAKEGKSELVLWCAAKLAMGEHPWTGTAMTPIDVAYFDFEMTEDDLDERLSDFGFDLDRLDRLHYALLPPIHALDTETGGAELLGLVESVNAQAVIIDTFARVVNGEENSADTVKEFYRHTGIRLKQAGIGYLRLDHAGKDRTRQMRGTSAKRDDIDIIWAQRRTTTGVLLDCTGSSRLNWVGPQLAVDRDVDAKTGIVSYSSSVRIGWPSGTAEKAAELDQVNLPLDAGRPAAVAALKAAGLKPGRLQVLGSALKYRREAAPTVPNPVGTVLGNSKPGTTGEQPEDGPADLFSDQPKQ